LPQTYPFVARAGPGPDANGNITDMDGWDLARYRANPVVLWSHRLEEPPIGRAVELALDGHRLTASIEFAPTPQGKEVEQLVAAGYIKGISAGWRPLKWEWLKGKDGWPTGIHSHTQELHELSIVPIPAQAHALRAILGQDSHIAALVEAAAQDLITDPIMPAQRDPAQLLAAINAQLRAL
jgi:HK97 family phage prohead protease